VRGDASSTVSGVLDLALDGAAAITALFRPGRRASPLHVGPCRRALFLPAAGAPHRRMSASEEPMRYVWTYLVVVVVFAFGYLCASAFTLGDD
jgi:hypothetical protein